MSPMSHPANILVMGPGGYRFTDYLKLGLPLTLIVFVTVMVLLPIFWPLTDDSLCALYRDNGGSRRLFHSTSRDHGRTWSQPVITNFPNATSKLFSLRTSSGVRIDPSKALPR